MTKLEIKQHENDKLVGGLDAEIGEDTVIEITTYGKYGPETSCRLSREDAVRLRDFLTLHTPESAIVQ